MLMGSNICDRYTNHDT